MTSAPLRRERRPDVDVDVTIRYASLSDATLGASRTRKVRQRKKKELPPDYTGKQPSLIVNAQVTRPTHQPPFPAHHAVTHSAVPSITNPLALVEECEKCEKADEYIDKLDESMTALGRQTEQLGDTAVGHMRNTVISTMQNPQERTVSLSSLDKNSSDDIFAPFNGIFNCERRQLLDFSQSLLNNLSEDLDTAAAQAKRNGQKMRGIIEFKPQYAY